MIKDKNLYFLRYKNDHAVISHITTFLEQYLVAKEEAMFDKFLQELVIFIASKTYNGYHSTFTGVDLEFEKTGVHYLVKIKSGIHWEDD
ncbi:MAG TPA: PmeII family type II restriction endonuclease, partial [Aggregatilineales bacterium]|nr:PmeII family type II restriction endonuclease [Aggregatilineales bacterium]